MWLQNRGVTLPRFIVTLGYRLHRCAALRTLRQIDATQWAACGIAVSQQWFATAHELFEFRIQPMSGAVVLWRRPDREYGLLMNHTTTTLTIQRCDGSQHTLAYAALYQRGGIDIAVLAPLPVVPLPAYAPLAHAVALFDRQLIVRFDTPNHPLRTDQAWHVGRGAFEVMALAADSCCPTSTRNCTHVAMIMQDLWQRCGAAGQLVSYWAADHPLSAGRQLLLQAADAFVDAQFFLNIVCTQFPLTTPHRAFESCRG
jgi:hypothetical protein